jgi:FAD/FMN-containing dehydrogenase
MDQERLADCLAELARRTGGDLRTDRYSRMFYATDASIYQLTPFAVFLPRDTDEVQAAVEVAARYQMPVTPAAAAPAWPVRR